VSNGWYSWRDFQAQFNRLETRTIRIEAKVDALMLELLKTERAIQVAYEAELDAAEAAAKQNSDTDDSVEQILVAVTALVASLKTTGTDPATAKRITDLAAALTARSAQLATAAAAVPAA
jgi:hypothetical protein